MGHSSIEPRIRNALRWSTLWPLLGALAIGVLVALGLTRDADRALVASVQSVQDCRLVDLSNWVAIPLSGELTLLYCAILSVLLFRGGAGIWSLTPWLVVASVPFEYASKLLVPQAHVPDLTWPPSAGCPVSYALTDVPTPGTFPSGHAIRTAYFAVLSALYARSRMSNWALWWLAIVAIAVVMAWARLYRSAHWPSDVLAGTLLGVSLALVAWRLMNFSPRDSTRGVRARQSALRPAPPG